MNILAIESAVGDGSIAIIRDPLPGILHPGDGASRAEHIMLIISVMLERAGISKHELDLIAVSAGPGSYSGIRIGLSTALGLHDALGIRVVGVPVLTAMASAAPANGPVICAVPVGKSDVAWQSFGPAVAGKREATDRPHMTSSSSFASQLTGTPDAALFAHQQLFERIKGVVPDVAFFDAGTGLAEYVGRYAAGDAVSTESMKPLYLRNEDAVARPF